jgi:hypothetical protein
MWIEQGELLAESRGNTYRAAHFLSPWLWLAGMPMRRMTKTADHMGTR